MRAVGEPAARFRSAAPDQVEGDGPIGLCAEIGVAGLGAEMRQVDKGHCVGRADTEDRAGGEREEPLAGPQHGKGAEEPLAVDLDVPIRHVRGVAGQAWRGKLQRCHGDVTPCPRDAARESG